MKSSLKLRLPSLAHSLALALSLSLFLGITAHAGSTAGEDSANYYKSHPDEYDGKRVDVDCTHLTRINGGPQIEGVTFFVAHTKDDDNDSKGGAITVAVLEEDADSFLRRYGSAPEFDNGKSKKLDSKRLRGDFHQLEKGHVYIDASMGEAHKKLLEHREDAKKAIGGADGFKPDWTPGPGKKKKF
jgi:hypothetical protein